MVITKRYTKEQTARCDSFAGVEYEDFVSIEQSLRTQIASHIDWAQETLQARIEARYGHCVANSKTNAIKAEAKARVEAIIRKAASDLAQPTTATSISKRNPASEQDTAA